MRVFILKKILQHRNIDWLLHFTRVDNLNNIFKYGLLPRSDLTTNRIDVAINDEYRYDNCTDAICLSVEFPNYKMFYKLRKENPAVKWAVLLLYAELICNFDCAFCHDNAGSTRVFNIPIAERKGKKAFERMFDELPNGPTRKEMGLDSYLPTNPQAEILVFQKIPVSYISTVFFDDYTTLNHYRNIIPAQIKTRIEGRAFSYRKDYSYWR